MADVVVRLERRDLVKLIHAGKCHGQLGAASRAQAALDSPPVDEGREYRVVEDIEVDEEGREWVVNGSPSLVERSGTERLLAHRRERGAKKARMQSRTITTVSDGSSFISPWTDLPSEEGECQ